MTAIRFLTVCIVLVACTYTTTADASIEKASIRCDQVGLVPDSVRRDFSLDPFYKKHVDSGGIPILASNAPEDAALIRACHLLDNMLSRRPDVRAKLIELRARFVVIGRDEGTADVPEYGFREKSREERDAINARARGLGGQAASCGEENLMCLSGDRYPDESICVHEFAHTIGQGVYELDHRFGYRLQVAFDDAKAKGRLANSYRGENPNEYWAEGVQDWYNTNAQANPPNGVHNTVNTRSELKRFDQGLHALINEIFPVDTEWGDCHVPRQDD